MARVLLFVGSAGWTDAPAHRARVWRMLGSTIEWCWCAGDCRESARVSHHSLPPVYDPVDKAYGAPTLVW